MHLSAAQKKRTANFRDDETKLLIQLWGNPMVQAQINSSHRKGPIMVQIAAIMHRYGFYRTPEEITTRIRNLKCIYHRIKRSQNNGIFCTESPDWHHFKALDAILGDTFKKRIDSETEIKKEPDNQALGNDCESVCSPTHMDRDMTTSAPVSPMEGTTASSPVQQDSFDDEMNSSPFSFSENSLEMGHMQSYRAQRVKTESRSDLPSGKSKHDIPQGTESNHIPQKNNEVQSLLQQLLEVEREHLELEKQRLAFDRQIGAQLMCLIPIVSTILQKQPVPQQVEETSWDCNTSQSSSQDGHNFTSESY